jgi:hypothetical protein
MCAIGAFSPTDLIRGSFAENLSRLNFRKTRKKASHQKFQKRKETSHDRDLKKLSQRHIRTVPLKTNEKPTG